MVHFSLLAWYQMWLGVLKLPSHEFTLDSILPHPWLRDTNVTEQEFEALLLRSESESLDFKSAHYQIRDATDEEKAKLVKDVLAFANSWRDGPAYILIGVAETCSGKAEVVGVAEDRHPDDATLQQLICSKTNRPIRFGYHRLTVQGKSVGAIRVDHPLDRPFFLNRPFGGVPSNIVFVRRGSAISEASPDEVARMGITARARPIPKLLIEWADVHGRTRIGSRASIVVDRLTVPSPGTAAFNAYWHAINREANESRSLLAALQPNRAPTVRQRFSALQRKIRVASVSFWMKNEGQVPAREARAELSIPLREGFELLTPEELGVPAEERDYVPAHLADGIEWEETNVAWLVTVTARKLQAGQELFINDQLFIAADVQQQIVCPVSLFSDELPSPQKTELRLQLGVRTRAFDPRARKK